MNTGRHSKLRAARLQSVALILPIAMGLSACGGGGGAGGGPGSASLPPVSSPPGPSPTPSPPSSANQSPVLMKPAADQQAITGHAFSYDVSQGGTAVVDPDGDPLTYQINVLVGPSGLVLPKGLMLSGTTISGAPTEAGVWQIAAQVDDGRGGNSVNFEFYLRVVPNSPPAIVNANTPQLVSVGASVDYDATQNGTTFRDPDGDALTYSLTLRGNPQGLTVLGTRIQGTLNAIGAVEVIITANDGYGGITEDAFLIAAPAAPPSAPPVLPSSSYLYQDEELPLPYVFSLSSQSQAPLWDTQPLDNRTTDAGATLGRVLFYDKRLSITNTLACASCHQQSYGFASPQQFNTGVLGMPLKRNTMALANARYNINQAWFSDMRVRGDLRNLIFMPIDDHDELGMALYPIETKLQNTAFYPPLFAAAFGTPEVTRPRIAAALAQFVQALISYRSKSDLANNPMTNVPPNPAAVFTAQEMQGFQIYNDHCSICHEVRANTNVWQANNGLDAIPTDPGTLDPALQRNGALGVFRAASLRNIAVTAPYMHDGRFATLREVIDHYDHGVQAGPYLDAILIDPATAMPRQLNLSDADKAALEAFLDTLTDNAFLTDPKFSDPFPP